MTAMLLIGKVTLVLAIALVLDLALRRKAVLACATMWNAVLVSLVLTPAAALLLPQLPLAILTQSVSGDSAGPVAATPGAVSLAEPSHLPTDDQRTAGSPSHSTQKAGWSVPSVGQSLAALYGAGVFIGLIRLMLSLRAVRRLRLRSAPLACSVWQARLTHWMTCLQCGPVELRQSDSVDVPLMLGWLRPVIVVPPSMVAGADAPHCDAVLVHELAHVLRGDFAWQLLQRVVQSALWFHPLMYLAARPVQFMRERACDEFAVHALGGSQRYGETLLDIASRLTRPPSLGLALGVLRTPQIASRIEALLESAGNARCTLSARAWCAVLVLCIGVAAVLGSVRLVQALSPDDQKTPEASGEKTPGDKAARTMQVLVVDPDGRPVAGAKIHVSVWSKEPGYKNRDYICDDEGQTKFGLPKQIQILRLWATHKGHVGMFANWWPEHESKPREIPTEYTYRLEKGSTVGGVVKNADGEPIAGARVEARLVAPGGQVEAAQLEVGPLPNIWLAEQDAVKTDAEGRWSLDNVPAADDTEVFVMLGHADYISESKWGGLQREQGVTMRSLRDGSATIVMQRGLVVSGVVTDPDGKPVRDAIIVRGNDPYFEWGSQEVRTGADGAYRLPPQPEGPLAVTVIAEGWSPDQQKIDLAPGSLTADFKLKRGGLTRIHFIDDSGASIPEVSVTIQPGWRGNSALYNFVHPNVLTTKVPNQADKSGVYEWSWSPADDVSYSFYKEGYLDAKLTTGPGEHVVTLRKQ